MPVSEWRQRTKIHRKNDRKKLSMRRNFFLKKLFDDVNLPSFQNIMRATKYIIDKNPKQNALRKAEETSKATCLEIWT